MRSDLMIKKYKGYQQHGVALFAVTLSTYVKDGELANSDLMRHFWEYHFVHRVKRCLPYKAKIDYDWVVECAPEASYHFHGLLAVEPKYASKIWSKGQLRSKLKMSLATFADPGSYRPLSVNKFEIEPIRGLEKWCTYITKQAPVFTELAPVPTNLLTRQFRGMHGL